MNYTKMFDIDKVGTNNDYERSGPARLADRTKEPVYEYTTEIELAVNVALATGRPLLVRGPSGSGKSSLARSIAHKLGWRYYEFNVTSRTNAQDLLWTFDSVQRLNDAMDSNTPMKDRSEYLKPGVLWWAFDRESASKFKSSEPFSPQPDSVGSVVLIDEIDKAEPDVPNNLLIPVGSLWFPVDEIDQQVKASTEHPPLIVITTNDERQLPSAFLRRCVVQKLTAPLELRLKAIAVKHFGERNDTLYEALAKEIVEAAKNGERPEPNAAEFLDAVWACISLQVRPPKDGQKPTEEWISVREATLVKPKLTSL
ncbi:MAG TPA: MoxR family ATPase [Pyrinomonadaceae bacterium]|nr:MoxR family ATPase [Pyrinomonadaceae bacterium]